MPSSSFSLALSARYLRTWSRSSSACSAGMRCIRAHIFSRASSLSSRQLCCTLANPLEPCWWHTALLHSPDHESTYLCSLFPCPTLQNPYVIIAPVARRYTAGRKPRTGRLRLYWTGLYPPTGGISCGIVGGVLGVLNGSVKGAVGGAES